VRDGRREPGADRVDEAGEQRRGHERHVTGTTTIVRSPARRSACRIPWTGWKLACGSRQTSTSVSGGSSVSGLATTTASPTTGRSESNAQ
jgi:hypothetical protein